MFKSKKVKRYEALYIDIAQRISDMSHAERLKVGCVLVNDDNILSFGFNGAPAGFENACEDSDGTTLPHVLHAESNCISKVAKTPCPQRGLRSTVRTPPVWIVASLLHKQESKRLFMPQSIERTLVSIY